MERGHFLLRFAQGHGRIECLGHGLVPDMSWCLVIVGGSRTTRKLTRLPESAFRAPQCLPTPAYWTKVGISENGQRAGKSCPNLRRARLPNRRAAIRAGYNPYWRPAMMEFSFPCVSVSSSGDEYFQVCFEEPDDSDEAYLLIQRQFEDDDGGCFYVECPNELLGGHFKIRRAELGRAVLRLEFWSRPAETIQIRFVASDAKYKELKRMLSIMIPADVFHVVV
jgi:hypothetical protein